MEWEEPGNISFTHLLQVAKSLQLFINQGHYHPIASLVKGELQTMDKEEKAIRGKGSERAVHRQTVKGTPPPADGFADSCLGNKAIL